MSSGATLAILGLAMQSQLDQPTASCEQPQPLFDWADRVVAAADDPPWHQEVLLAEAPAMVDALWYWQGQCGEELPVIVLEHELVPEGRCPTVHRRITSELRAAARLAALGHGNAADALTATSERHLRGPCRTPWTDRQLQDRSIPADRRGHGACRCGALRLAPARAYAPSPCGTSRSMMRMFERARPPRIDEHFFGPSDGVVEWRGSRVRGHACPWWCDGVGVSRPWSARAHVQDVSADGIVELPGPAALARTSTSAGDLKVTAYTDAGEPIATAALERFAAQAASCGVGGPTDASTLEFLDTWRGRAFPGRSAGFDDECVEAAASRTLEALAWGWLVVWREDPR